MGHTPWHNTAPRKPNSGQMRFKLKSAKIKQVFEEEYAKNPFVCKHCNKEIPYEKAKLRKADRKYYKFTNTFCGSSCAASYNNAHKTHGNRRSKLEAYIEEQLTVLYPNLEMHFNRKDTINSELDIFIPSLKLAFELNGIYHYEPIHGKDKLKSIQNNDNRKFQACLERDIELCIIDASKLTYFKESNATPYLDIVKKIVEQKLLWEDSNFHDEQINSLLAYR